MGIPNPQGDFDKFQQYPYPEIGIEFGGEEESPPPIVPYNDIGRETGIASMYGQGPQWDLGGRVYEDEFRDFTSRMGDMPGGPMTYEEFVEAYKRGVLPDLIMVAHPLMGVVETLVETRRQWPHQEDQLLDLMI